MAHFKEVTIRCDDLQGENYECKWDRHLQG